VKLRNVFLIIALIIVADQALKIWIKTDYPTGKVMEIFPWFHLHFIENPGMAWGWKFGNETGKVVLTLFRLAAVIFGTWYLARIVKHHYHKGFIVCAALIYAGALGNLIDSMFYGMIFDKGLVFDSVNAKDYIGYSGVASLSSHGYSSFLHGSVVDMLYFPIFETTLPSWIPFMGGEQFEFFSPIFNIADASISVGVITLLVFQKKFFKKKKEEDNYTTVETNANISDEVQVQ
jgi:signal peptidase II